MKTVYEETVYKETVTEKEEMAKDGRSTVEIC